MTYLDVLHVLKEIADPLYNNFLQFPEKDKLTQLTYPSLFYTAGITTVNYVEGYCFSSFSLYSLDNMVQCEGLLPDELYSNQLALLITYVSAIRKRFPIADCSFSQVMFEGLDYLGGARADITLRWKYDLWCDDKIV